MTESRPFATSPPAPVAFAVSEAPLTIVILGPTAGGKTELATALCRELPAGGECLCADSMQVYRGMDIGTAKPTLDERALAPHHLLDLVDPNDESFSVDRWLELANDAEESVRSRGRHPIVVGGTNLYVKAFLEGLFDGPAPDPTLRRALEAMDPATLRTELERVDPQAAGRIHPNDRKRTVRAIEVFRTTGSPISRLQREWDSGRMRAHTLIAGLEYSTESINRRINARVRTMVERGLVDEARALWQEDRLGQLAREALGYKQLIDHFEGRTTLDETFERIKILTRRYARQQRTWLRRFRVYPNAIWFPAEDMEAQDIVSSILTRVRQPLDQALT